MINIVLFCSTGLSTNLLIRKMEIAAEEKNLEIRINSYPEAQKLLFIRDADVVLIGPQIRFALPEIQEECKKHHVPLEVINSNDYGLMDGEKVLNQALRLYSM